MVLMQLMLMRNSEQPGCVFVSTLERFRLPLKSEVVVVQPRGSIVVALTILRLEHPSYAWFLYPLARRAQHRLLSLWLARTRST